MPHTVCIVGAGVVGVSTGVCIQETIPDVEVTIVADKFTPDTTSDGAGGLWEPHALGSTPVHLMKQWCDATFKHLSKLLQLEDANDAGVHLASGYHVFREKVRDPDWAGSVYGFRTLTESDEELKMFPGYKYAWFFTSIMCEGPRYLPWLTKRYKGKGGKLVKRHLNSLSELSSKYDVVVNCSGLGAYSLIDDKTMYPIRGQLVRVDAPWVKHFVAFDDFVYYIFPGDKTVALGGTHQYKDWRQTNDEKDCDKVFDGCCKLVPSLKKSKVLGKWAGLRPGRPTVRLEKEKMNFRGEHMKVVHNYGHGGGGISLHWGCAQDATRLVKESLSSSMIPTSRL
ncbi:D-aspartate oxidase-like [Glandiceps talaboti]